jgi:hypothetical protein
MNLLLYAEARQTLAQRRGQPEASGASSFSLYEPVTLSDTLFEELGYYGALEETAERDAVDWTDWRQWPADSTHRQPWTTRPVLPLPASG